MTFKKNAVFNLSSKAFPPSLFLSLHNKASRVCFSSASKYSEGVNAPGGSHKPDYSTSKSDKYLDDVAYETKEKAKGKMNEGAEKTKESVREMKENAKEKTQQVKETTKERADEMRKNVKSTGETIWEKARETTQKIKETVVRKPKGDDVDDDRVRKPTKEGYGWEVKDEDEVELRMKAGGIQLDDDENAKKQ